MQILGAQNILGDVICRQTWPRCKEWRARNTRRISFGAVDAGHLGIRNRPTPCELIPQNRGEPWQYLGGVLYDVEIRVRFR
jgi:hypothetical protein